MKQLPLLGVNELHDSRDDFTLAEFNAFSLTRLSRNFILRDLLYSTEAAYLGLTNLPECPDMVIRSGKALCEKILEPINEVFGRPAITFGYQSREAIEFGWSEAKKQSHRYSSNPHNFDRKTWGDAVYARVDILPFCVEDGEITRYEFGRWLMHNLDIDLLMQWRRSNVYCITISPKPRRVWIEFGNMALREPSRTTYMGTEYWRKVYPILPINERPRFGPSCTGGSMRWKES